MRISEIKKSKTLGGFPVKVLHIQDQGVAEGFDKEAEAYKSHLLKTAPKVMNFLAKAVKGWRPSEEEMLGAIDTGYMVMKHTGDVQQAGRAMMDELNTLHRMSQGQQGVAEDMSRRGFLRGAGALAVGSALAGGASADNQTDPNKLIAIVNINGESKEFNLTGRFKGDAKSQLHQAEDFITEFLEKRDINFSNLELRYQGAVLKTQNIGSVKEEQGMAEEYNPEYDDESGMAETNLVTIARAAQGLLDTIDDHENLPEWVQEKIAKVEGMIVTAWDYLKSQEAQGIDPRQSHSHQVAEAIKLNAPQRKIPRDELQGYADRIKTGTKTKRDKFSPIIHGSNIKAITKDDENTEWDLDDLSRQITTRPKAILGTNAKMEKSKTEGEIIYDLTLPALSGIVVDEDTGDFVEITTCPGAGACQLFCYARKGGYVMFPASSMSAAQALNFLVNDPEGYSARVNQEIKAVKTRADKAGIQLVVRWHDAGDFFSKEYLDLAYGVANANPDVQFYAYTKMGDVATGATPANFTMNFSSGSKRGEEKKVEFYKQQNPGATVKQGVTVPKDMFFDLIARKGTSLIKDAKGRTQFASSEALDTFKQRIAQQYKVAPDSIITYDQMLATPVGPTPKWNVIVQPGAGDRAANRKDVIDSYLMFH